MNKKGTVFFVAPILIAGLVIVGMFGTQARREKTAENGKTILQKIVNPPPPSVDK